jgi:hypothetical protein
MSAYSIHVDWTSESSFSRWENEGQRVMRELYEENPKEAQRDGHDVEKEDGKLTVKYLGEVLNNWRPMMNYAYPLETTPSDDEILKVCRETCLTVMKDTEDWDDKYYLALCGGGMDLSQSIARAYQIIENWIPVALLTEVCKQPELSVHGKNWLTMARQIRKQIKMEVANLKSADKQRGVNMREYKISHIKKKEAKK